MSNPPQAVVLMGVSGCGKTSVGAELSRILGWPFFDGDDFHPPENVAKMAAGIPLNDDDRAPWLANLHDLIAEHLRRGQSVLLACSALKQKYRTQLAAGNPGTVFVHLKGDFDLIFGRMQARAGHYMKAEMLRSQFATLEEPTEALTVDINQNLDRIVVEIITQLKKS
ncbi:MAG TPA: gluconate kinase [Chloroflexi bacterium]|nr:gluconate kinase [Chloroflexota bacterium]